MFKKLGLFIIAMLVGGGISFADVNVGEALGKLPNVNQGVAFSLEDSKFYGLSATEVATWKDVSIEAGIIYDVEKGESPEEENSKDDDVGIVGVVSYDLGSLEQLGVDVPILKEIGLKPGLFAGYARIENAGEAEFTYGLSVYILDVQF